MWQAWLPPPLVRLITVVVYCMGLRAWCHAAGGELTPVRMIAVGSGMTATYMLDHIGQPSSYSNGWFTELAALAVSAAGAGASCYQEPALLRKFAAFAALAAFYDTPVPRLGVRIKALFPFSKTLFVPAMHVMWGAAVSEADVWAEAWAWMFLYYVLLNVAMDFKDVEDDASRGVITVPNALGWECAIRALCATSGAGAVLALGAARPAMSVAFAALGVQLASYVGLRVAPSNLIYYYELWHLVGVHLTGSSL